jgi:hypothetical protein
MQASQHMATFFHICASLAARATDPVAHPRSHIDALHALLAEGGAALRAEERLRQRAPNVSAAYRDLAEAAARAQADGQRSSPPTATLASTVLAAVAAAERAGANGMLTAEDASALMDTLLAMCVTCAHICLSSDASQLTVKVRPGVADDQ